MEIVIVLFVVFLIAGLGVLITQADTWEETLEATATALDLRVVPGSGLEVSTVQGAIDGIEIVIDREKRGKTTYTRIRATGGQPVSLRIRSVGMGLEKMLGATDIEIGDPALDSLAMIDGEPEDLVRSRLDAKTRRAVADAIETGAELSDGVWTLAVGTVITDPMHLETLTRTVLDAARALRTPEDWSGRLAWIASTDPVADVRVRALRCLIRRRPDPAEIAPFQQDPDPRIAVTAARFLGEAGRDVLRACLGGAEDVRVSAALGIAALPDGPGRDDAEEALRARVPHGESHVIDALGRIGTVGSVPALTALVGGFGITEPERRARDAIRAIQARIVGAERGTLALAESREGQLSLARKRSTEG